MATVQGLKATTLRQASGGPHGRASRRQARSDLFNTSPVTISVEDSELPSASWPAAF